MPPPQTVLAAIDGVSLSLQDFFNILHRRRQLEPLVRNALAEKILLDQADRLGLTVSDAELQQASDRFRYSHGLTSAEQTKQWLQREGFSLTAFQANLALDLVLQKCKRQLIEPCLAEQFLVQRERFARAELRHLVVSSEELARELLAQITEEGRAFADLAREYSLDSLSRHMGGSLGFVLRHTLPESAAAVIFAARPGQVVGPIMTHQGYHLFEVLSLLAPVLDEITAAVLRQELFQTWLNEHLRELRLDLSWLEGV
jgi:parvulin-like peptidyl-prolyl isomerase